MLKNKYEQKASDLAVAIDIAITTFKKFPHKDWDEGTLQQVINTYTSWKNDILHPEPKYKNLKNLNFMTNAIFTPFQEGTGVDVNYFWEKVRSNQLEYKRENKLIKVLKRQKIKNQQEYDFIIDVILPYQQEGLIRAEEVNILNRLIASFESFHENRHSK